MVATFGRRERIARRKERFRACVRARACGGKRRGTDDPKLDFSFQVQEGRRRSLADWRCSRASVQRELIVDSGRTRSFRKASALSSMVCVCVCVRACLASGCVLTRTRRERAEYMGQPTASGHRNATLTHHTHSRHDRAHHRLSRYRGVGWKRKGVGEEVCLYSVSVRLMTTCRGCSRRERDEDEIRSCLRSSLIEKLG